MYFGKSPQHTLGALRVLFSCAPEASTVRQKKLFLLGATTIKRIIVDAHYPTVCVSLEREGLGLPGPRFKGSMSDLPTGSIVGGRTFAG